jgi:CheY-like chemotaxis protein
LLEIINEILDFSKIEAGRVDVRNEPVNIRTMLNGVADLLRVDVQNQGLALNIDVAPDLPSHIGTDPGRLRQVLLNLAGNAVKFTRQGSVTITVTQPAENMVSFDVTDTGIGISPDDAARLFQPFTQVDSSDSRKFGGTGLGLSISKRLVELLGGTIGVQSTPDVGSTFRFSIPFRPVPETESTETVAVLPDVATIHGPSRSRPVLLVEDNKVNQKVASRLLEKLGLEVETAWNGQEALDKFEPGKYAAVLMDCQMPVMDGFEATRQIRQREGASRTPVIAVTARALPEDRELCRQADMDGYVSKPIDFAVLTDTLSGFVKQSGHAAGQ